MASFTVITVKGEGHLGLTVDESVGAGGDNRFGDVMLIQAMMWYVLPFRHFDLNDPGAEWPTPPGVTGMYDFDTDRTVDYYQRSRGSRVMKSDGRIDPPSYGRKVGSGRNAKWVQRNLVNIDGSPLMTMTMLHFEARKVAKYHLGHERYTTGLIGLFPQLRSHLKGTDYEKMHWLK